MMFKRLAVLSLLSIIHGSILPRDEAAISASITKISDDITALNSALTAFVGGPDQISEALDIQNQATSLNEDIQSATKTASASNSLSSADSSTIAYQIIGLSKNIYSVLDNLVSKYDAFENTLPMSIGLVESDLQMLKNSTDDFASALEPKFVPDLNTVAPLLVANIDYHFVQAIIAYNTSTSA